MARKSKDAPVKDYQPEIDALVYEANSLPLGPTKLSLLEQAVRIADMHNDLDQSYQLRNRVIDAATFSGRIDVLLVTFAWSLAAFDRHPGRFDEAELLWRYKWVTGDINEFPSVPMAKIEDMLTDMERRFTAAGYSTHSVLQRRRGVYLDVNNIDGAKRTNKELRKLRPDGMTDCRACSLALDGSYYESLRQWKKQLEAIAPVLKGRYACNSQPLGSVSRALRTLLRLGRRDEAMALQKQTVNRLKNQQNHSKHAARHVEFLALVGDTTGAKRIWVRFLPESLSSVSLDDRQFILRAGIVLLDRLLGLEQATTIRIPAHPDLPPPNAKGAHEIPTLREWMWNDALRIAAQFDARNGNDGEAQKTLELPRLIKKLAAT